MRALHLLVGRLGRQDDHRVAAATLSANTEDELLRPIRPGAFGRWIKEREAADRAATAQVRGARVTSRRPTA